MPKAGQVVSIMAPIYYQGIYTFSYLPLVPLQTTIFIKYSRYHGRNGSLSLRALKAKRQQQMPVAGLS